MDKEEIQKARVLIWEINQKQKLDSEDISNVTKTIRKLIDAYTGATKKLFKLRSRLRSENEKL